MAKIVLFNEAKNESIVLDRSSTLKVGRGFFECNDKRVSRKHGEITVFEENISIKSCHTNPIFYKQKGEQQYQILQEHSTVFLGDKDSFSLLPNEFVYQIRITEIAEENDTALSEGDRPTEQYLRVRNVSQINREDLPTVQEASTSVNEIESHSNGQNQGDTSETRKRSHESEKAEVGFKRTKSVTESDLTASSSSVIIKPDPDALSTSTENQTSTNIQPSSSLSIKIKPDPDALPVPQNLPVQNIATTSNNLATSIKTDPATDQTKSTVDQKNLSLRPSCKFGVRCFQTSSEHRASSAHHTDSDYRRPDYPPAPADAPPCPFGTSCYRRNPDHFVRLQHPPSSFYSVQAKAPVPQPQAAIVQPATCNSTPSIAISQINEGDSSSEEDAADTDCDFDDDMIDADYDPDVAGNDVSEVDEADEDDDNNCEE